MLTWESVGGRLTIYARLPPVGQLDTRGYCTDRHPPWRGRHSTAGCLRCGHEAHQMLKWKCGWHTLSPIWVKHFRFRSFSRYIEQVEARLTYSSMHFMKTIEIHIKSSSLAANYIISFESPATECVVWKKTIRKIQIKFKQFNHRKFINEMVI